MAETTTPSQPPQKQPNAPKQPKAPKPQIQVPSSIQTTYILLRGVIHSLFGLPTLSKNDTPLQNTFVTEAPLLTGKFGISFGKKCGTLSEIPLPIASEEQDAIWRTVESITERCIEEQTKIYQWVCQRSEVEERYGKEVLHSNIKKYEKEMTLVYIPNLFLGTVPKNATLYSNCNSLKKVTIQCGASAWDSKITSSAKGKKAEMGVKFLVEECNPPKEDVSPTRDFPSKEEVATLFEKKGRLPESDALRPPAAEPEPIKTEPEPIKTEPEPCTPPPLAAEQDEEMVVSAFEVKGKVDYDKLVTQFGSQLLTPSIQTRLSNLVEQRRVSKDIPLLHHWLRRDIFFSHRDFHKLLTCLEAGQEVYLYTGRGPSSEAMHLGHLVPFLFTAWLQKALNLPLVIQMTDDEKFLWKGEYIDGDYNLSHYQNLTVQNAKDIIACEFLKEKTFIFSDVEYVGRMYPNILKIWKSVTSNAVSSIFGFDARSNAGQIAFPAIQAAPAFASSFIPTVFPPTSVDMTCLIPCAIDQDPYFRMTRDVAYKLTGPKHPVQGKPCLIHSKFFPPLQGSEGKMSSSDENSAVFLTDTPEQIQEKILHHAYSGGRESKELQKKHGADLDADVSYQWLKFFMEDDEEYAKIGQEYGSGQGKEYWSTNSVKRKLIQVLQDLVGAHQRRRVGVTDEVVREWMSERLLKI